MANEKPQITPVDAGRNDPPDASPSVTVDAGPGGGSEHRADERDEGTATPDGGVRSRGEGAGASDVDDPGVCGLDGCDLPLPVRALDEHGRPKAGRRPQYCSKAHADAASRQRRVRDVASVADPLTLARTAGEAFLPGARALAAQLTDLIARFDEAEAGALARVQAAERDAVTAAGEASAAREEAAAAEMARRQALAQGRQARQARDTAITAAERARAEADQIRTAAWEQVAAHERVRGQAEAARAAAQTSGEALAGQNRELRAQVERVSDELARARADLGDAREDLERAAGQHRTVAAQLAAVERLTGQEGDRLRAEAEQLRGRVGELEGRGREHQQEAAVQASQRQAAEEEVARWRAEADAARARAEAVAVELAAERSGWEQERRSWDQERAGLAAAARRRRKLTATAAVRADRPGAPGPGPR